MSDPKDIAPPATPIVSPDAVAPAAAPVAPVARMLRRTPAPALSAPTVAPVAEAKKLGTEERASRVISRLRNEVAETKTVREERDALKTELSEYAKAQLAGAPESVRKFIERRAKDDPRGALQLLRELREDGLVPSGAPAGPPANTAPKSATGGAVAPPQGDDAILAEYRQLAAKTPRVADAFRMQHAAAISRATAKQKQSSAN